MFILKGLLLILASMAAILIVARSVMIEHGNLRKVNPAGVALALSLFLAVFVGTLGFGQIEAGNRGVVLRFGQVTGTILGEGLYWVTPLVESVQVLDVRTRAFTADAAAASRDLQVVHTTITLNYSLNPSAVGTIFQQLGHDYEARIVSPAVQESVKASTAQYDAERLIIERPTVKDSIEQALTERLQQHGITVDPGGVSITSFDFSPEFNAAIEKKVTATQNALTEQNNLQATKFRADQAIAQATGEAEAIRLKAQALRTSPEVLQLNAIEKWNGVMPQFYGSNGPMPFLQVGGR